MDRDPQAPPEQISDNGLSGKFIANNKTESGALLKIFQQFNPYKLIFRNFSIFKNFFKIIAGF